MPCRRSRFGGAEPVTINNRDQTPDESISYLEQAKISGVFDDASFQKLTECYRTSVQSQSTDCVAQCIELIWPYFKLDMNT